MGVSPDRKPQPRKDVLLQKSGEEAVLYILGSDKVHVLNEVGAHIWSLLDGQRSIAEIARAVEERFEVDGSTAIADVGGFLGDLERLGMLASDA